MSKILLLIVTFFVASCSLHIKNTNNTGYEYLKPKVEFHTSQNAPSVNLSNIFGENFQSNNILYEENNTYNYYAYTKWLSPPVYILKESILQSLKYVKIDPYAPYNLKILLFHYEPHFNGNKMYVKLSCRAFIYDNSFKLIASKQFNYEINFNQKTNNSMLDATSEAQNLFLKDLNNWLQGEVKK